MSKPLLSSLAILKSNWDHGGRSYIDYFIPFVADCLRASGADQMSPGEIASAVQKRFGVAMPESVINTALKRAANDGLGVRRERGFTIDKVAVARVNLDADRANAMRQGNGLVRTLQRWGGRPPESTLMPTVRTRCGRSTVLSNVSSVLRQTVTASFLRVMMMLSSLFVH